MSIFRISFSFSSENKKEKNILQISKLNSASVDGILVLDIISKDILNLLRNGTKYSNSFD